MKNIFVYTGKGAYQARDIESFLAVFDYDYQRIGEEDFTKLGPSDLLIVPGGQISEYTEVFSQNADVITRFIENGGTYLGICAGVSALAATQLIPPVTHEKGFSKLVATDNDSISYDVIAENPPILPSIKGAQTLLTNIDKKPLALRLFKGEGTILLLAVHAEGSVYYKHHPKDFSGSIFLQKLIEE